MPTTNAGTYTEHWQSILLFNDGRAEIALAYTNTANGNGRGIRILFVPASSASPILDQDRATVAAGGAWSTFATAIQTFLTAIGTTETNAASGGKLDI